MPALENISVPSKKRKRVQLEDSENGIPAVNPIARKINGGVISRQISKQDIRLLENQIKESQRHYNSIQTLLTIAKQEASRTEPDAPAIIALCRVFTRLLADGRLTKSNVASQNELKIVNWLKERYMDYQRLLLTLLESSGSTSKLQLQCIALHSGMQLVREEVINAGASADSVWRTSLFVKLFMAMLRCESADGICDEYHEKYVNVFDDIRHYTFILVAQNLGSSNNEEDMTWIRDNSLRLLSQIEPYDAKTVTLDRLFAPTKGKKAVQDLSVSAHKNQAQKAWLAVLASGLDKDQRKDVLQNLTHSVVPWVQNVELLMDFLTDSYNIGGATSLLSLSGLFYLIQEKNLDYPDFFMKLYSLLDSDLMYSKHRSRFFRLLNTFMSSTHLPAALVASFIKRLSRLALDAPPAAIVTVVPFLYNLLKSHPTCTFMIHRVPDVKEELQGLEEGGMEDVFDMEEPDPMETDAIDSCLWELTTLQKHYHPNVASLAKIISEQFTKSSYNLEDFLDHSYNSLLASELEKDMKKTPVVEYEIPKHIFTLPNGENSLERLINKVLETQN